MGLILRDNAVSVKEGFLSVHEGNSVPLLIDGVLLVVPLERVLYHIFISMEIWVVLRVPCGNEGLVAPALESAG